MCICFLLIFNLLFINQACAEDSFLERMEKQRQNALKHRKYRDLLLKNLALYFNNRKPVVFAPKLKKYDGIAISCIVTDTCGKPDAIFKEDNDAYSNDSNKNYNSCYSDIIPVVTIVPNYPRKAAIARIEGWVKIEFTITEGGTVVNPIILESRPVRIFDREALRAILRYKFKPKICHGVSMKQTATQTIEFKLTKDY